MAQMYLVAFIQGEERTCKPLYLKKPLQTFLHYEMGAGLSFYQFDGSNRSGTIYYVMNYPTDAVNECILVEISVDREMYAELLQERSHWSEADPATELTSGISQVPKIRHLRVVEKPPEEPPKT